MQLQFEDAVDCLKVIFPGCDFLFLFDQSSGHTKKREGGLDANSMNVSFGGKSSVMRESNLSEGCIGPQSITPRLLEKVWRMDGASVRRY
jgi:hypothetical protein